MTQHRIFLTGGSGFVASRMVAHLAHTHPDAYQVCACTTDILSGAPLREALAAFQPDIVLHLAAQSHVPTAFRQPELTLQVNLEGTRQLLAALDSLAFSGTLLFVGSGDMYGLVADSALPVAEHQPLRPRNPYAAACWQRQAGAHQAPDRRQAAQRQIKADLRELWHPPSSD